MARTAHLPIVADRYEACVRTIIFRGMDLRGVPLRSQVRLLPDTPGAPLADLQSTLAVLHPVLAEDPVRGLANAAVFLEACGHTVLAWLWLEQARVAASALSAGPHADEAAFLEGKLQACRYFCRWELPRTQAQYALLRTLDETPLDMIAGWF